MNKLFVLFLGFLMIGGGCVNEPVAVIDTEEVPTVPSGEEADAFPSNEWQFIDTEDFLLPVDYAFTLEDKTTSSYRIQNFVGSDNPNEQYEDDSFFIEIYTGRAESKDAYVEDYDAFEDVELSDELVVRAMGRNPGGESWPGHGYYNQSRGVVINLFYRDEKGGELAESVIQNIEWGADARPDLFD